MATRDKRVSTQPSHKGAPRPAAVQGGRNGSAESQKTSTGSGLGIDLTSNVALISVGAIGLLAAAIVSVGLLSAPGERGTPTPGSQQPVASTTTSLVQPVAADDIEQAIARLMMSAPEKDRVREEIASDRLRLGWVTLSDIQQEDDDWVRLEAAGFRQDLRLLHKAYTIAVPYVPGSSITVTGLVDGGGGDITVAVYVGAAQVSLRPLKKGEMLQIPTP